MRLDLPPDVENAQLEQYRQQFERGDANALIVAVRFCHDQKIAAPEWVASAFAKATNKWYAMDVKELGDALGLAWPKGVHVNAMKKRRRLKFTVLNEVEAHIDGSPVDDALFEAIGAKLGIAKTLVKEYYRAARGMLHAPDTKRLRRKK